jgi:hypothetical protein
VVNNLISNPTEKRFISHFRYSEISFRVHSIIEVRA